MRHAEEVTEKTRVAPARRLPIGFIRFPLSAFVTLLLTIGTASVPALAGDVFVHGYTQRDGTYVPPHWRSAPDSGDNDDLTKALNVNAYTGQQGTGLHTFSTCSGGGLSASSGIPAMRISERPDAGGGEPVGPLRLRERE
jgi:hypothetical protein